VDKPNAEDVDAMLCGLKLPDGLKRAELAWEAAVEAGTLL
jgi:hypothetical protein